MKKKMSAQQMEQMRRAAAMYVSSMVKGSSKKAMKGAMNAGTNHVSGKDGYEVVSMPKRKKRK